MNIVIIGGTFSLEQEKKKSSGIINKMISCINGMRSFKWCMGVSFSANGGLPEELKTYVDSPVDYDADVTIWMPNISNEEEKYYPKKKQGSVLICSKVMREGYTRVDSISRIFKMHGNAVIEIRKNEETGIVSFTLVDALGNVWFNGSNIDSLMTSIMGFVAFTKSARRINTTKAGEFPVDKYFEDNEQNLKALLNVNRKLQHHIQTSCGNRFFGNISTRCQKLFPSTRIDSQIQSMFVSPRNSNKESLQPEDMVLYLMELDSYCGDNKPSVDSPAQSRLYSRMSNINFMIHGHAEINMEGVVSTKHYKLCGDVNEVDEILEVVKPESNSFIINLIGHGFLIGANTMDTLVDTVDVLIKKADFNITNN